MKIWSNTIDSTGTSMAMRDCVQVMIERGVFTKNINKVQIAKQLFSDCRSEQEVMRKINSIIGDTQ